MTDAGGGIHRLFEERVAHTPNACAVAVEGGQLTYLELDTRANQLARYLQRRGVRRGTFVALCLDRSLDVAIAILGVLKAGAAYVPLDPAYPEQRLRLMVADTEPVVLLTVRTFAARFPPSVPCVLMDTDGDAIDREVDTSLNLPVSPSQLAYVIYTSGSSGTPKGVLIQHDGLVNQIAAATGQFKLTPHDRVAQVSSLSFDMSVEEIFTTWSAGATLVFHPPGLTGAGEDFSQWVDRNRITVLCLPTAFWHEWAVDLDERGARPPHTLRMVMVGGQKALPAVLAKWQEIAGNSIDWLNAYGPTETTIIVTFFALERGTTWDPSAEIPIGRTVSGMEAYILDSQGRPCLPGETGELFLSGVGVAQGYLNAPGLTAERFLPDPFSSAPGERMYRTGDLARSGPDGVIEFRGRVDSQVKVRGFRVEPGEIEATIRRHESVQDAVVVTATEEDGRDARLVAYVVPARGSRATARILRGFVAQHLPDFMVPADYVFLAAFPLTPNGKTDRSCLPRPRRGRDQVGTAYVAPGGDIERRLAGIWSDVLGVVPVGVHDNFFELGGHSLRVAQVAARIRQTFGVALPLSALFSHPTIAATTAAIADVQHAEDAAVDFDTIPTAPRDEPLPLSFSQERVWFLQRLSPDSRAYHFQILFSLKGTLNIDALRASVNEIVRRHEIFRTTFEERHGTPVQVIHERFEVDLPVIDLRNLPPGEREDVFDTQVQNEVRRAFDLARLPLVRWMLVLLSVDDARLLHVEHHLIHDGWSLNVFRRELLTLYAAFVRGRVESPLPPLSIQFADYASWERRRGANGEFEPQLEYWKKQLTGLPPLELPISRLRPSAQTFDGAVHIMEVAPDLYARLRSVSDARNATLFMTLLGAFFILLHRYSGQPDLAVGCGVANRGRRETEGVLGMFVNNVVLRSTLRGNPRFDEFLEEVRSTALGAFANQEAPFDHVVRALGQRVQSGRNPLFQAMFSFHDAPLEEPVVPGLDFAGEAGLGNGSAKFDLNVVAVPRAEQRVRNELSEADSGIRLVWEYNVALFDAADVERMAAHYRVLLESIANAPHTRLSDLAMTEPDELRRVVDDWNRTAVPYPSRETVHGRFEHQAEDTPDATAIVADAVHVSYRELDRRANRLADQLLRCDLQRGQLVAIALERSVDLVVAMLGVLKTGAAYVPLELSVPDVRLEHVLADTQVALLITNSALAARCGGWIGRRLCLDSDGALDATGHSAQPSTDGTPDDLAYVMYTSGSSGLPKGVEVTHRGVLRLVWGLADVGFDSPTRILQMAPASFDASTFEIWAALLRGGTCVLAPPGISTVADIGRLCREHDISTLWLTASLFNTVIDESPDALSPIRLLFVGGDVLSVSHVRRAQAALPGTAIVNGYGPTESTTFACCHRLREPLDGASRSVPIGRPIGNTQVYLLDRSLNPVPVGIPGELFVGGDGLARGYLNRPALTAERFIPNPFGAPGSRLYRTGDRARYLPDGTIEFLGRDDDQVKIRGFRVELGEIEASLRQLCCVHDAAVVVHDDPEHGKRVAAYVVVSRDGGTTLAEVRDSLRRSLPDYMVPTWFVAVDELPLSSNGKVDRRALPPPTGDEQSAPPSAHAQSDLETNLLAIWRSVLGVDQLTVHDNFFDCGGHSLLAIRLIGRIRDEMQVQLPLSALFVHPTVAGLAERVAVEGSRQIATRLNESPWKYLFELTPGAHGRPVFFVPGGFGGDYEFLVYARLTHFVGDEYQFIGLRPRSASGVEPAQSTVEGMAKDYLEEIQTFQPSGPYLLVGNCVGGALAFELARQMARAGAAVGALVLMDTDYPTYKRYSRYLWERVRGDISARLRLDYYRGRMSLHRRALGGLGVIDKLRYTAGRMATAMSDGASLAGSAIASAGATDSESAVRNTYLAALRRYRPKRYPGSLALILSQDKTFQRAVVRWSQVVDGDVRLHQAPGDHLASVRDHARVTARLLRECLHEAIVTEQPLNRLKSRVPNVHPDRGRPDLTKTQLTHSDRQGS